MIPNLIRFFKTDIWRIPAGNLRGRKGLLLRTLRIVVLSFKEFSSDQCSLRASALTFYSLLSIVPVFAMAFGISKGFGLDKLLKEKLLESMQSQQEVLGRVVEFSEMLLQNTKGGVIAGVGLALLFWTVIGVLTNIEMAFNHIWGITKPRTLGRKFADYLAFMLIAPVFFVVASSATVFIASQVRNVTESVAPLHTIGPVVFFGLKFLPYFVFWGLLTYVYMFLPNGKIHFRSALLGGIVAGTVYQGVQWLYIHFQIGAANAGAIYGTFAALPLFLVWLQTSWVIVLYGAELAFAHQNEKKFEFERECVSASEEFKELLALRMVQIAVNRFSLGLTPLLDEEIAAEIGLPIRLARDILSRLTKANLLSLVKGENERDQRYQPARDVSDMTVRFVVREFEKAGTEDIPLKPSPELDRLREVLRVFDRELETLPENALLSQLKQIVK